MNILWQKTYEEIYNIIPGGYCQCDTNQKSQTILAIEMNFLYTATGVQDFILLCNVHFKKQRNITKY